MTTGSHRICQVALAMQAAYCRSENGQTAERFETSRPPSFPLARLQVCLLAVVDMSDRPVP